MKAKDITLGGIMISLTVVILYLTTIIPINTLSLLTLASILIPICIIRSNIKTAILVYAGSSIISLFILPINYSLMYILLFGIYGILKYFIEKINKLYLEIILKLLFFNIALFLGLLLIKTLLIDLGIKISLWLFILGGQFVFLIYDYILTLLISYYL